VAEGTPDALKRRVSGDLVLVGTGDPGRVAAIAERLGSATELVVGDRSARFRVPDGASMLPGLLRELDAAGVAMTSVEVRRPSLDDVFLALTGRTLRDAEQKVSA
jgi:ABC-2 type transport system ATP-binding protein